LKIGDQRSDQDGADQRRPKGCTQVLGGTLQTADFAASFRWDRGHVYIAELRGHQSEACANQSQGDGKTG
jgi:hypothetical protein